MAYNSKNNVWEHLECSYHTVLPHCEQQEKTNNQKEKHNGAKLQQRLA